MKATELMLGDWIKDYTYGAVRVSSLEGRSIGIKVGDKEYSAIHPQQANPIPLTAEILEKNGWKKNSNKSFRYLDEDTRVEMDFYLGNGLFNITKHLYLEDEVTYSLPEPYFTHELQHLLRLCGLNDLADNFRID